MTVRNAEAECLPEFLRLAAQSWLRAEDSSSGDCIVRRELKGLGRHACEKCKGIGLAKSRTIRACGHRRAPIVVMAGSQAAASLIAVPASPTIRLCTVLFYICLGRVCGCCCCRCSPPGDAKEEGRLSRTC